KERVNVFLDGEFAFGLALIEAAMLHKGQQLSDAEISALKAGDEVQQAYDRAIRFLGQRPRSTAEVRRSLSQRQIDAGVIDEVIARLEGQGYLDDAAFARYWIGNRQQFRPRGERALRFELREKGVPDSIIGETLSGFDTSEAAYQAAQDRARRLRGLEKREFREKLGAFMARRGFDFETVREVTDRLWAEIHQDAGQGSGFVPPTTDDIEES
ncbi:MAG TPA: RecX family transcriptional regulator, partial [Aggregatilineales bacterium]|nr:RecX family transcriptional regulator [Aggregatilineales bacterium]